MRGVTYGPFRPESDGSEYHTPELAQRDFAQMQRHGVNAVRIYTVPPRWLLDLANQVQTPTTLNLAAPEKDSEYIFSSLEGFRGLFGENAHIISMSGPSLRYIHEAA